ncbi:MAG: rubrerythrin family protein, partial [Muribaculaceae bacterium]|nr:rubrerythrin family protein [Muribaculaceae bacterium]
NLLAGCTAQVKDCYPAGVVGYTRTNLAEAAACEREEWSDLYENFSRIAQEEGFPAIANTFKLVARAEQVHEQRYQRLLERLESGTEFSSEEPIEWYCRKCGFVVETKDAPRRCPVCGAPQGFFERKAENY